MRSISVLVSCLFTVATCVNNRHISLNKNSFSKLSSSKQSESIASSALNTQGSIILRCEGLSKSYTGSPQFEKVSLNICKGQRLGLIGINGAGKSTLLKCLARIDTPDGGLIETGSNCNVVYVDQEPDWGHIMVYEAIFSGNSPQASATREYFKLLDPSALSIDNDRLSDATDSMESSSAWEYQTDGMSIAEKLNIPNDYLYRDVQSLSGGEKKRVSLSAALLKRPDVLLLDEVRLV